MNLSLDDLGRAAWGAEWRAVLAKDAALPPLEDIDKPTAYAGALAVAEKLLNYLSELADDEPLDGHELRAVLAELKGEMK